MQRKHHFCKYEWKAKHVKLCSIRKDTLQGAHVPGKIVRKQIKNTTHCAFLWTNISLANIKKYYLKKYTFCLSHAKLNVQGGLQSFVIRVSQ